MNSSCFAFIRLFLGLLIVSAFTTCSKGPQKEVEIYAADFEDDNLFQIAGGKIESFIDSKVLGRYNNGGFTLELNKLPKHDLVRISFDLFIHDSWDGNKVASDGPDIWQLKVNGEVYINTTFSNENCPQYFCSPQSYPSDYLNNNNNPKKGAFRSDLPGVCPFAGLSGGTSLYKIEKIVRHSADKLTIECLDKLVQTNTADPQCDESWSVDNIRVTAVTLD